MKTVVKTLAVLAIFAPAQAFAATGNIPFNGTVTDTCAITVGTPGTIMPNAGYTVLGSKESGGVAGTATILSTGTSKSVYADAPTAWTTAPASAASATFAAEYDLAGAVTASNVAGATGTALALGTTNVSVDLTATLASGNFEAGTYAATVVLRCE